MPYFTAPAIVIDGTTAKASDVNDLSTATKVAFDLAETDMGTATASAAAAAASAAAALVSEGLADADAIATAADRAVTTQDAIDTAADVVLTHADVVLTNADVVTSAASAAAAAASYDSFDDRYLGAKAAGPTLDNDGAALTDGALYYNTTTNIMMVYDLGTTTWVTAVSSNAATSTDSYKAVSGKAIDITTDTNLQTWADTLPSSGLYNINLTAAQGDLPTGWWYIEYLRHSYDAVGNLFHTMTATRLGTGSRIKRSNTCIGGSWTGWVGMTDDDTMATVTDTVPASGESVKAYVDNGTATMSNKTLTSPVINTGVSGTAFLDEDNMVSNSATRLASQQSIKAYVDAVADAVEAHADAGDAGLYTSFSPGGDFTAGTVYAAKVGRVVTLTFTSLSHTAASLAISTLGVIPGAYRPVTGTSVLSGFSVLGLLTITAGGTISVSYRNLSDATVNSLQSLSNTASISYISIV